MRQFFVGLCVFLVCSSVRGPLAFSQNLTDSTDKFFNGLSEIIERNMNNPVNCLREVDTYYQTNQALVQKIRSGTAEAMKQIKPMMEEYMSEENASMAASDFNEAGLQELEHKMGSYKSQQPPRSAAAERYAKAMEAFSVKHPQYALKVAMKAMELMPEMDIPLGQSAE